MVHVSLKLFQKAVKKRKAFIDSLYIYVRGGGGGNGLPKYGGIGGKGGDVYIVGAENKTLKNIVVLNPAKRFVAGTGENSKSYRILGKPGEDKIIPSPLGITVIGENNNILGEVNVEGDQILVAKGGKGGGPENQYLGRKGQAQMITLDLKLIADVGFVGFPNAGKSTLLKALSRASPKIANYPFTTITPSIGVMTYDDHRQITLADLPGLIEGAHINFGMGHKFLKHVIRTKLLLFIVDISGFQLNQHSCHRNALETVMLLNKELELYKEELIERPAILAVNKMDLTNAESEFEALKENLKHIKENNSNICSDMMPKNLVEFDDIIPVAANKAQNIERLKDRIRQVIDFHAAVKRDNQLKSLQLSTPTYEEETKSLRLA